MRFMIIMHRFIWAGACARVLNLQPLGDRIFNNKIWLTQSAKKQQQRQTAKKAAIVTLWSSNNSFCCDVNATRQIYCDHFNLNKALHINIVAIIWFWFAHWWHSNEWKWLKAIWNHSSEIWQQQQQTTSLFEWISYCECCSDLIACSFLETAKKYETNGL